MSPRGNPHPTGSKPDKLMRDALMLALNRAAVGADGQPTKRLNIIAEKLVSLAENGESWAILEVYNRVDGKSPQALAFQTGDGDDLFNLNDLVPLARDIAFALRKGADETTKEPA